VNILSSFNHKVRKELHTQISNTLIGLAVLVSMVVSSTSYAVNITVSIPTLAGVIAPLLSEDDQLHVLLKPGASPHGFQLKPSHMKTLHNSDIVVWVGTPVDQWMKKPLAKLNAIQISLKDLEGIEELPIREGGLWERKMAHSHGSGEEHHDKPLKRMDGHLWMSYKNNLLLINAVVEQLKKQSPHLAMAIEQRAESWLSKLKVADEESSSRLATVKNVPYMVLHDAFQYFENHYQLNAVGSIRLNPSVSPSLKRVHTLRERIESGGVRCVFKEPQFPEKRVTAVVRDLDVNLGSLDPLGVVSGEVQADKAGDYMLYDDFLRQLSRQFYDCLSTEAEHNPVVK